MVSAHVTSSNSYPIRGGTAPLKGVSGRKSARPPLLPADSDNGPTVPAPRPKVGKVVSSRYLSSSSSTSSSSAASSSVGVSPMKRCPSPSPAVSRTGTSSAATPLIKRSQSAERRKPGTPRPGTTVMRDSGDGKTASAQRILASARSLSVSFQGESYSVPVDKVRTATEKPTPVVTVRPMTSGGLRKGTPERSRNATVDVPVDKFRTATEKPMPVVTVRPMTGGGLRKGTPERSRNATADVPVDKVRTATEKPTPVVTARPITGSGVRKGTPERSRNATVETRRVSADSLKAAMEQKHRWPGRSAVSMSVDFGNGAILNRSFVRDLSSSMMATGVMGSCKGSGDKLDSKIDLQLKEGDCDYKGNLEIACNRTSTNEFVGSDGESASSGSILTVKESIGDVPGVMNSIDNALHRVRGIHVPARFRQETSNQLARPPSPMAAASKFPSTPKKLVSKGPGSDSPGSSPKGYLSSRRHASPLRGTVRPASPSKFGSLSLPSPARGLSPSRVKNVNEGSAISSTPSMLSFAAEARRGKMGESRIFDAHALRLLHNRLLQWKFINARADDALFAQRLNAETSLNNSWMKISKLLESVKAKALNLQLLKHILKLSSVLNEQMVYLEKWASMDGDYSNSLLGATEAFHASTLRLPVISGARVNVQKLKDAVHSALEMLQAMATSICIASSNVGEVHHFVTELVDVTLQERALLDQCTDLLSTNAAMQINECSLRAHMLQRNKVPPLV